MNDKVIVVTGASSGIGAALARLLSVEAAGVVLVARREAELSNIARECGRQASFIAADLTRRAEVQRVVREVVAKSGRIDVWVNNVGRGITRLPSQLSDDDIASMMQVNVMSALYGMQEVLPHFRERGTGQIVNVSSMLGRIPNTVFRAAYTGSKHFLNALTANFRDELRDSYPGIVVSLVSPGGTRTEFGANALHGGPLSQTLPDTQSAEEVAAVIADVIRSRRLDVYTRDGSSARVVRYFSAIGEDPKG